MKQSFDLPVPPSVNHCWTHTRNGTFRKPEYIKWLREAGVAANVQKVYRMPGTIAVSITIYPGAGWNPVRDIDNCSKCVLDFLQPDRRTNSGGVISGDDCRTLQRLFIAIGQPTQNSFITVRVKTIQNPIQILTKTQIKKAEVENRKSLRQVENDAKRKMARGSGTNKKTTTKGRNRSGG